MADKREYLRSFEDTSDDQRFEPIWEALDRTGQVRRLDILDHFDRGGETITENTATRVLKRFMEAHPDVIEYDRSKAAYVDKREEKANVR